ncbi:hypothetical protein [Sulfitobacter sp. R18_1]|uniref:hypothetical protein n=1 Tax=Sulfitobacter sp. R18_1 TaxID=2821104 RepID=UPI001ADC6CC2|nr:hypothetical protein [Sulfitobacter sp. R18_1]MBO9428189.1 hypothetical protein [Sulfitobacter sp. R18_1]
MTEETYSTDGAECPYCGHVDDADNSDGALYSDDMDEWTCGSCNKPFKVSLYIHYTWTATPYDDVAHPEDPEGEHNDA